MPKELSKIPEFISIHVPTWRQVAATMSDLDFGGWCKKALNDFSLGCIGECVDELVKTTYENTVESMNKARDRKRAAYERRKKEESSEQKVSLPVKAPDQLTYGKMENVYLTQDEFNDLATQVGNLNEANNLIDNLSCKLADGSFQSDNHFATLCYWASYRKEKGSSNTRPMTFKEIDEQNEIESLRKFGLIK